MASARIVRPWETNEKTEKPQATEASDSPKKVPQEKASPELKSTQPIQFLPSTPVSGLSPRTLPKMNLSPMLPNHGVSIVLPTVPKTSLPPSKPFVPSPGLSPIQHVIPAMKSSPSLPPGISSPQPVPHSPVHGQQTGQAVAVISPQVHQQHRLILQEFAQLSRSAEGTWVVALSQSYLQHCQLLEKQRSLNPAANVYYDQQRLELIHHSRRHLQSFLTLIKPQPKSVSPREPQVATRDSNTPDNGYESAASSEGDSPKDTQSAKPTVFRRRTRDVLEQWYIRHLDSPYVDHETATAIAEQAGITTIQVRKWLSNRRNRDKNTRRTAQCHAMRRYYTYSGFFDAYYPSQLC